MAANAYETFLEKLREGDGWIIAGTIVFDERADPFDPPDPEEIGSEAFGFRVAEGRVEITHESETDGSVTLAGLGELGGALDGPARLSELLGVRK